MPSRLRVSYFNQRTGKEVSANNPADMTYRQALRVFRSLMAGSFFALELSPPYLLQLLNEEGAWYTEILNMDTRTAVGCTLSQPMAEQALDAVFQGQAIEAFLAEHYEWVRWEAVDMTRADEQSNT